MTGKTEVPRSAFKASRDPKSGLSFDHKACINNKEKVGERKFSTVLSLKYGQPLLSFEFPALNKLIRFSGFPSQFMVPWSRILKLQVEEL